MILLSRDELAELTGKATPSAQSKVLDAIRVPYLRRPDGSIIVSRIVVETVLGAQAAQQRTGRPQIRPRHEATQTR